MSKEAFLPLFFGDFLASTAEWEGEEQALYLLLLCHQWSLGSLPAEPRRICKLVRWDWQLFERCWATVGAKFQANAGRLLNQRLEQHRAKTHQISEKRARAGKKGGETTQAIARDALKQLLESGEANASNLLDPLSHPIPSHPIQEKSKKSDRAAAQPEPSEFVEIRREFPKRAGSHRWPAALSHFRARVAEGVDPQVMLAGVRRYAAFMRATGKEATEYVQQAATFLGKGKDYELPWKPPPKQETAHDRMSRMLNGIDEASVIEHERKIAILPGR